MIATYHNHTTYSDGSGSIAEMIEAASEQGVEELGISDHFNLHPSGQIPSWSMSPDRLGEYVDEILSHRGRMVPELRLGLEIDWHPGHEEVIREAIQGIPFDYLIGSVHEVNGFKIDRSSAAWDALSEEGRVAKNREYWMHLRSMAESGLFDIVAHADLPKKFGHRVTGDLDDVIDPALDAMVEADMVVEVNTAGWIKPVQDAYPSMDLLKKFRERNIPAIISADAHEPAHLLRDFPRAGKRLLKAGYENVIRFAGRERISEHIEARIARF